MVRGVYNRSVQSATGIWYVLRRPVWACVALGVAFLMSCIIFLSIHFTFYGPLLTSPYAAFSDRLYTIGVMTTTMAKSYVADTNGVLLLMVSLMQGIAIAVFIYTARRNRKMDAAVVGRSGFALLFSVLGLGCVPCGTSLLIPVMTLIFSSSAPALLGTANLIILVAALLLTLYSLYKIGQVAYKYKVSEV